MHLAALHGEEHVVAAAIAHHHLVLHAQNIQHQMGQPGDEQSVLAAGRLTLCPVGHHYRSREPPVGYGVPLGRHREPGATMAGHAAGTELVNEVRTR